MVTASKVRTLRNERGMTRERLAAKTGLAVRTLSEVEAGTVDPRLSTLVAIAAALDLTVNDLLGESAA